MEQWSQEQALVEERRLRNRRQEQLLKFMACVVGLWAMGVVLVANPKWFFLVEKGLSQDEMVGYLSVAEGRHEADFEGATVTVELDVDGIDASVPIDVKGQSARKPSFITGAFACTQYEAEPLIMEAAACPDTVLSTLMFAGTVKITWRPEQGDAVVYEGRLTTGELMTITGGFGRHSRIRLEAEGGGRALEVELHMDTLNTDNDAYEVNLFSLEGHGMGVTHGKARVPDKFSFVFPEHAGAFD